MITWLLIGHISISRSLLSLVVRTCRSDRPSMRARAEISPRSCRNCAHHLFPFALGRRQRVADGGERVGPFVGSCAHAEAANARGSSCAGDVGAAAGSRRLISARIPTHSPAQPTSETPRRSAKAAVRRITWRSSAPRVATGRAKVGRGGPRRTSAGRHTS